MVILCDGNPSAGARHWQIALVLLDQMPRLRLSIDSISLTVALSACGGNLQWQRALIMWLGCWATLMGWNVDFCFSFVLFYGLFINFWWPLFWYRIMMIMVMIMFGCFLFSCYCHISLLRLLLSLHTAKPTMCAEGLLFRSCSVKGACLEFRHDTISHIPLHRVSYY